MAQAIYPDGDDHFFALSPKGIVAKAMIESYSHNARCLRDDPVFGDIPRTYHEMALQQPAVVPRICFYSAIDATVPPDGIELSAKWSEAVRGSPIEMVRFENTRHCKHHELDDGVVYFGRLEDWLTRLKLPTQRVS